MQAVSSYKLDDQDIILQPSPAKNLALAVKNELPVVDNEETKESLAPREEKHALETEESKEPADACSNETGLPTDEIDENGNQL